MAVKRNDIEIGDLVRKTNSTDWIWQVAAFVTPAGHQPHARRPGGNPEPEPPVGTGLRSG